MDEMKVEDHVEGDDKQFHVYEDFGNGTTIDDGMPI